ncbi:TonB-dependent receptor [Cecembia rubra]|uniref:TonB-dependent receptor-like protein n=1 Tax=Cecembia rubra TaxID=1485585 RepID=A0A2P8E0L1_9BACT|nr:TonB-dependent receptor [Cecembia rubra]PSL03014.1 TonB-dependent receptor-like protein [Cecembia rubra]
MRNLFVFGLLFLFCVPVFSQTATIRGKVTDSQTGEPLPFCNVFINNTTIATTTDLDGNYILDNVPEGEFELGYSFIGYQAVQKPASIRPGSQLTFNISLVSLEQELSDVEVKASRDRNWERELRRFKNYFLGNDDMAAQCEILNPWVIDFPTDNSNNNFRAEAIQPIEIENKALGYKLTFDLKAFQFTPNYYIISGATRFTDLEAPDAKTRAEWERKRLDTYLKSPANMFRAMIVNQHNQEGFYLYGDKAGGSESRNLRSDVFANELGKSVVPYKPDNLVQAGRRPGEYRIYMKGRIEIHYEKGYSTVNTYKDAPYPISWVEVNGNYVQVNSNGMILNQKDVIFSGDMDKRKIATLLPLDYQPNLAERVNTQVARDANGMQEKVFLHTDRAFYYQGDPILFKAYFNYATMDLKRELSKILYVELISGERDMILQKKFKIENGQAFGELFLPDTLSQRTYYLRAYTNWNRNYGPDTYFVQALPVLSPYERITASEISQAKSEDIIVGFSTPENSYGKREKVKVSLTIKDKEGRPVATSLSVAVRDGKFAPELIERHSIAQTLQIKDVPSNITTEKFTYPLEKDWNVSGKFLNEKGRPAATPFTVYFNNFEGMLDLESDKDGLFTLEAMDYYGPLEFTFMALDKKGKTFGSFELVERLHPPFFVPASLRFPKISKVNESIFEKLPTSDEAIPLEQVTVESQKEDSGNRAIYGRADYVIKGENLNRNGTITDLLMSLKSQVPGMNVTTTLEIRIRGGATSSNLSMEPLVMINGAVMPSAAGIRAADNIATVNPNDIDRIEVVSRMSSMMGDLGRNGVIAVYLKQGPSQAPLLGSNTPGLNNLIIDGFGFPPSFIPFNYEQAEEKPEIDQRVTLFWDPYVVTDNETGTFSFEFFTNDSPGEKIIEVIGLSIDGKPIQATYSIPIRH